MSASDIAEAISTATGIPHYGEELGVGISQVSPIGFQPGEPSYFVRIEHAALRNTVAIEAGPFSGRLIAALVDRNERHPSDASNLAAKSAALGWEVNSVPAQGSSILFAARENNAAISESADVRSGHMLKVCILLTEFMIGSLAITQVPARTRAARKRNEAIAENVSWEYDPAERDRSTATHRRLENWLIDQLEGEGIQPLDPDGDVEFDLAWLERDGSLSVCEVKSTTGHENGQIRLGLGQVLHYAAKLRQGGARSVNPVLFVESEPDDAVWMPLCDEHGVILAWPASWNAIRARREEEYPAGVSE